MLTSVYMAILVAGVLVVLVTWQRISRSGSETSDSSVDGRDDNPFATSPRLTVGQMGDDGVGGAYSFALARGDEDTQRDQAMTLQNRLRYANLQGYPPYVFSLLQILLSLAAFGIARTVFELPLQVVSLCFGPIVVNKWIERRMRKRMKLFDRDFAPFLLSVVGMLKTGLNTFQALESAAEGLEPQSLVRKEVGLMLERLRVGVTEDRSIGSFGETISHPEVDLFVQAIILSRRVGGTLSDTLDRLSKQARKRQIFRMSASAAVAQQRGSLWAIIGLIAALQIFMYFMKPDMVINGWTTPVCRPWSQAGVVVILAAIWTMDRLTKFKV